MRTHSPAPRGVMAVDRSVVDIAAACVPRTVRRVAVGAHCASVLEVHVQHDLHIETY